MMHACIVDIEAQAIASRRANLLIAHCNGLFAKSFSLIFVMEIRRTPDSQFNHCFRSNNDDGAVKEEVR